MLSSSGENEAQPFLGRDLMHARNYSESVAAIVDEEISKLITEAHQEAFDILTENRDVLDALVVELLERETLDKAEVAEIFEPLRRRDDRPAWTGSDSSRIPSTIPPVALEAAKAGACDEPTPATVIAPDSGPDGQTDDPSPRLFRRPRLLHER